MVSILGEEVEELNYIEGIEKGESMLFLSPMATLTL